MAAAKAKESREPAAEPRPIEISNIKNNNVAEMLAQSCSEAGWSEFTQWTKASGYLGRSLTEPVTISTLKNGIKIETLEIESTFNNHKIELVFKGHKYSGNDACLAFIDFINGEKLPTEDASLILDSAALASSLSGALGGIELLMNPPVNGSALPMIEVAFYFGTDASKRMNTKIDLEHVLTADFSLKCNATSVTIQSATHKILVRKTAAQSAPKNASGGISVFDRESNLSDVNDKTSEYSKKALGYVTQLAKACSNAETADDIRRAAEDQLTQAHVKVAAAVRRPDQTPGSGNAERRPASEGAKP
jgi:hypothetical protein